MTNAAKDLRYWFNPETHQVIEVRDPVVANEMFLSMTSSSWGAGPITGTAYYQLLRLSPESVGRRSTVMVCKQSVLDPVQ